MKTAKKMAEPCDLDPHEITDTYKVNSKEYIKTKFDQIFLDLRY